MADGVAGFRRLVRTGFGFTMNICLAVMCYLLVFAEPVVLFVSGEAFAGADYRRGEPHVVRQLLRGDVHPVPAGPREADGNVEHRGGPGERGAQPAVGRPVRGGGRGRCAFGHRGDRPAHRALVRPRRALVFRVLARPGVHGGVQRDRRCSMIWRIDAC